jgi:hypothetical protein
MVKKIYELYNNKINVKFIHIIANTDNTDIHSMGNKCADILANKAIKEKIYLDIPFINKDIIKDLGGKWDKTIKKWYIFNNSNNKEEILLQFKQVIDLK